MTVSSINDEVQISWMRTSLRAVRVPFSGHADLLLHLISDTCRDLGETRH